MNRPEDVLERRLALEQAVLLYSRNPNPVNDRTLDATLTTAKAFLEFLTKEAKR